MSAILEPSADTYDEMVGSITKEHNLGKDASELVTGYRTLLNSEYIT